MNRFQAGTASVSHPPSPSDDPKLIERFSRLMASRDWPVDARHMQRASAYAYKRLAIAYSSGDTVLRALSMSLFQRYQAEAAAAVPTRRRIRTAR